MTRTGHTYLVTGASRGIGLEFIRQLTARGDRAIGTVRTADHAAKLKSLGAQPVTLDVSDPASIDGLSERLAAAGIQTLDVLINNAGVSGEAKTIAAVTASEFARVFQVNAFASMLVTRGTVDLLRRGGRKLVVQVSSELGSIAQNTSGSSYSYRASKAAENQLTKSLSNELAREGFTCIALHPGWVRTDMGGPNAHLSVEDSVSHMLRTLDALTPADTGRFLTWDGRTLPW